MPNDDDNNYDDDNDDIDDDDDERGAMRKLCKTRFAEGGRRDNFPRCCCLLCHGHHEHHDDNGDHDDHDDHDHDHQLQLFS